MKKWKILLIYSIIGIIIIGSSFYLFINKNEAESEIEEPVILLQNDKTTLTVNKSIYQRILSNTTSNITSFKVKCTNIIPEVYKNKTIDYFIGSNYTKDHDIYQISYVSNSSNRRLSFQNEGVISYYDPDVTGIIPISEAESNSSLLKKCKNIFNKIGINQSNLQLHSIKNSIASSYNSNTKKRTILGYGDQTVVFNQCINGYVVDGEKGRITLRFGKDAKLSIFRDDRIIISEIIYKQKKINSLNDTVSKMSLYSSQLPEGENQLIDWDLVVYVPSFETIPINGYNLHYIFRFAPKDSSKVRYVVIPSD